eukprot:scaffold1602_cov129-Skeletonema_marinoi.AAC.3
MASDDGFWLVMWKMSSSRRKTAGGAPGAVFAYQTTSCCTNYYNDNVNMLYCCEFVVAEYAAKFGVEWLFIGW